MRLIKFLGIRRATSTLFNKTVVVLCCLRPCGRCNFHCFFQLPLKFVNPPALLGRPYSSSVTHKQGALQTVLPKTTSATHCTALGWRSRKYIGRAPGLFEKGIRIF